MKFKVTLVSTSLALLLVNNSWAQDEPYYSMEVISVSAEGANYGPYPSAISDDGDYIATYSMKAALSADIDIGLPFTFNRPCQYDYDLCEGEFYGSETEGQLSYKNAYQAWRNAQSDAASGDDASGDGYESYMFANTILPDDSDVLSPFDSASVDVTSVDVKNTDITANFVVGYSSAPYDEYGDRDFARRGFIQPINGGDATWLLPKAFDDDNGGFSSAYKIQEVSYDDGDTSRLLVVGNASVSYPDDDDDDDYFYECYHSDEYDYAGNMNELVSCPGFNTQAWAWEITSDSEDSDLIGFALATSWLDDDDDVILSASALDINASGIAVGVSTSNDDTDGYQRAIIMTPDDQGVYDSPTEITAAASYGVSDQEETIYNTWAVTISDAGIITGNREFAEPQQSNEATEFFVYDNDTGEIQFPLFNKKVAATLQYINNGSQYVAKTGANSRVHDANESGWMVGEVDDYDQTDPVNGGSPRSQSAFLYHYDTDSTDDTADIWFINDLICTKDDNGEVSSPFIRLRSARVINDDGVVLAEGFVYPTQYDYIYKLNATAVSYKLTPNENVTPATSPNCWDSPLLVELQLELDWPYERQGAASLWLWLFALPLLFIRRFKG